MEKSYLFKIWQIHATVLFYLKARRLRLREPRVFCFLWHGFWTWIYMGTGSVVFLGKHWHFQRKAIGNKYSTEFWLPEQYECWVSSSGSGVDRTMYRMPLYRLRARQAEKSLLFRSFSYHGQCLHYEYINIRCGASVVRTTQQQQSRGTLVLGPLTATRVKQNSAATSMASLVKMRAKQFWTISIKYHHSAHRCSSSSASTTYHWLGSVYSF